MTDLQLFSLYNILCLVGVLAVSIALSRRYSTPFYQMWLKAYTVITLIVGTELVASFTGRFLALDLAEFVFAVTAAWYMAWAANAVRGKGRPSSVYLAMLVVLCAVGIGLRVSGTPYQTACLPPVLPYIGGYFWLGGVLVHWGRQWQTVATRFMGFPLIGVGLALAVYPILLGTPFLWAGFVLSGALQLLNGAGIVVYVLEEHSRELQEQNERLSQLDRLKEQFMSTVSHELKTPISIINSSTYMMTTGGREPLTEQQTELMRMIQTGTNQLKHLVGDILDFATMKSGELHYRVGRHAIGGIVDEVVQSMSGQFSAKGVSLGLEQPQEPIVLQCDRNRIVQVLMNLLGNALKFTEKGGAVQLRTRVVGNDVVIDVEDTGIGIAPEQVERIFDRFYQVDGSDTRRAGGVGLGLAIAKAIVEDGHGGKLRVQSRPGGGSTFSVVLRLTQTTELPALPPRVPKDA